MEKRFELFSCVVGDSIEDHEMDTSYNVLNLEYLVDLLNEQDEKIKRQNEKIKRDKNIIQSNYQNIRSIYCDEIDKQDEKIKELTEQNKKIKEDLIYEKNFWNENNKNYHYLYKELENKNCQLQQAQNQKAIEILKNIIKFIENKHGNYYPAPFEIKSFIQNQISELGGKYEK